jgi:hypothetical protein
MFQRMHPRLNTEKQQAAQLQCSLRHLVDLRNKRLIPFIRLGRSIRYDPNAVQRALEKLTIKEL